MQTTRRTGQTALRLAAACAAGWLASTPALADSMRCGSKLVRDGDTRDSVVAKCGQPTDVQTRIVLRRPYYDLNGRIVYFGEGLIEVPVEIWTYNFGPYKLMRRLRIADGIVEEIETLGYGYHDEPG